MKKFLICLIITLAISGTSIYASSNTQEQEGNIPSFTMEEWMIMMQAKQGKVEIIKKNNVEIESLKVELKEKILMAAEKINNLKIDIKNGTVLITEETLNEFRELLQFLQDSKNTLEVDVEKTSREINNILDLISTRSIDLLQYDKLIEKQNDVIVKMKLILNTINKI